MPVSAFGAAMIQTLAGPPQTCALGNGGIIQCDDYLSLRTEEQTLLARVADCVTGPVLDIGCGIGRHLTYLRAARPDLLLLGAEICDAMRGHCAGAIAAPARFDADWRRLLADDGLGLVLLMGNGLGVLGDEPAARHDLAHLAHALRSGGRFLIETGHPFGPGNYTTLPCSLSWNGHTDNFVWGHASQNWIQNELGKLGLRVTIHRSFAPPSQGWFIAEAVKP